jgi:hypothetical protein
MPSEGLTTSTAGTVPIPVIGVRSFNGSKAGGSVKLGGMITEATDETSSVYPSGDAFMTAFAPTIPLAPALFSMTMGYPINGGSLLKTVRAKKSADPPAGNGTMICN